MGAAAEKFEIFSLGELRARSDAKRAASDAAHPRDDAHIRGFVIEQGHVCIWWSGEEYAIPLKDIDTPTRLLEWLEHIGEKNWKGMTGYRVALLIGKLGLQFKWKGNFYVGD
jgi:hypothetical protein